MGDIKNAAKGIEKAFEAVPQLYDDGLKPAVSNTGKVLGVGPAIIYAALAPLRKWVAQQEYNVAETEKILALKLEKIKPEDVVTPESYVAVPALQAISYCMDSDELRELYANLLAKSMVKNTKGDVHPAFAEIIKQLIPDEAKLLKAISAVRDVPLVSILYRNDKDRSFVEVVKNYSNIAKGVCEDPYRISSYIDNLERLKLIEIPWGVHIKSEELYKELKNDPDILAIMNSAPMDGYRYELQKKKMGLTQFGQDFADVCISDFADSGIAKSE